jgi:hypothetical protein
MKMLININNNPKKNKTQKFKNLKKNKSQAHHKKTVYNQIKIQKISINFTKKKSKILKLN